MRSILAFVFASALVLTGCSDEPAEPTSTLNTEFEAEGVLDFVRPDSSTIIRIAIELAESAEEQAQGLMFRRTMPDRGGMLFINPDEAQRQFWMKNTALSLDIMFTDASGRILNIVPATTPFSEDYVRSEGDAKYVVEVKAGFTSAYGISPGDHIRWRRQSFETTES